MQGYVMNQVYLTHNAETDEQKNELYQALENEGYEIRTSKLIIGGKQLISLTAPIKTIKSLSDLEEKVTKLAKELDCGYLIDKIYKADVEKLID